MGRGSVVLRRVESFPPISRARLSVGLWSEIYAKKRIGNELSSPATAGEGTQNVLCAYLSVEILVGLAANALAGWWWADPLVALLAERRRSQTYRAVGYTTARVLKTRWANGLMPLRRGG